ncbi:hypothetical protein MMC25_007953 [Agyrium rufum]|nr:hypothetical protein [Agyrium rufum]
MNPANPPAVPPRSSLRQKDVHRSRRSSKTTPSKASARDPVRPASEQVLSSLIENLQNISTHQSEYTHDAFYDEQHEMESRNRGPTSPRGLVNRQMAHKAYFGDQNTARLHPLDAAIPPLVRMSKHRHNIPPSLPLSPPASVNEMIRPSSSASQWKREVERDMLSPMRSFTSEQQRSPRGSYQEIRTSSKSNRSSKEHGLGINQDVPTSPTLSFFLNDSETSLDKERISPKKDSARAPKKATSFLEDESPDDVKHSPVEIPSRRSSRRFSGDPSVMVKHTGSPKLGIGKQVPSRKSSLRHSVGSGVRGAQKSIITQETSEVSPREESDVPLEGLQGTAAPRDEQDEADSTLKRIEELKARRASWHQDKQLAAAGFGTKDVQPAMNPPQTSSGSIAALQEIDPNKETIRTSRRKAHQQLDLPGPPRSISLNLTPSTASLHTSASRRSLSRRQTQHSHAPSNEKPDLPRSYSTPLPQPRPSQSDDRPSSTDSIDLEIERYLASPRLSQKIADPHTGRIITFSEVGDPIGSVVICCVGMGLTRYLMAFYDELATSLNLRIITPDRPGVGESDAYADGSDTPLGWPDDVLAICEHLKITRFSLLAHSAGAIYALATALRMPHYIRGKVHLLAPWIPPSQMTVIGTHQSPLPATALPYSQRLLRSLPTTFLKAANSRFLNTTSSSLAINVGGNSNSPRRSSRRKSGTPATDLSVNEEKLFLDSQRSSLSPNGPSDTFDLGSTSPAPHLSPSSPLRRQTYESRLTSLIFAYATTGANPAVDLLVCLERRQPIGFRYVDINKPVVIHHGTRDTRVPLDNVRWLGKMMRRCEVRELEGEGHGLMASAKVMGGVLEEVSKEWRDWNRVVKGRRGVGGERVMTGIGRMRSGSAMG